MNFVYKTEFGSSEPVRFLDPSQVKMYDNEGKEMIIPKCENCQCFKSELIGKTHSMWVCNSCGSQ